MGSKKRKIKIILIIAASILFWTVILPEVGGYLLYGYTHNPVPHGDPNTIWECQEYDMYFISDKQGRCFGEANINSKKYYFDAVWDCTLNAFIYEVEVDKDAQLVFVETPYGERYSVTQQLVYGGTFKCKKGLVVTDFEPERFYLWEADEPVKMTFVCQGHIPEVDIYNGVDPIRRMEVID